MLNLGLSILKAFLLLLVFLSLGLRAHNNDLTTHSTLPVYQRVTERINSLLADESPGRAWVKPLDGGDFMIQSSGRLILKDPLYLYNEDELEVLRVRGVTHKPPPPSIVPAKALTDYHYEYATIRVPIDLPSVDKIEQQHESPLFFQASGSFSAPFLLAVPNHENAFRIRVTVESNSLPPTSTGCYLNGVVVHDSEPLLSLVSPNIIVTTQLSLDKTLCTDDAQHSIQPLTYPPDGRKISRANVKVYQNGRAEARSREPRSAPEKKRSKALTTQGEGDDRRPPEKPVNYERQPPQSQAGSVDMGQLVNDMKRLSRALKNDDENLRTKKWSQKIQFIKHRITLLSPIEKAQLESNLDYQKCHSLLNPKDWREVRDYSHNSEQESSGRDDSSEQDPDTEANPENHQ